MTAVRPEVSRHALELATRTCPQPEARPDAGPRRATFPWRTITGPECSGYWPAGTAAFHVNADVADAVLRYVDATGDEEFAREAGAEILVETARMWCSLGHWGRDERFHVFGVTGPDEYSALGDDNVYTNLMLQRNLRGAARWARRFPDAVEPLEVRPRRDRGLGAGGRRRPPPVRRRTGRAPAVERLHRAAALGVSRARPENYPLHSHYLHCLQLYRKQVVKQADLVLALFLRGDAFTDEQKLRDFRYYEEITVRDSSLSACWAIIAAEVGLPHLAHEYVVESALADIRDPKHDSSDGLHVAALAGTWLALVCGFPGLRARLRRRSRPRRPVCSALPDELPRLRFRLLFRGRLLRVTVEPGVATCELVRGEPALTVRHEDGDVELAIGAPVTRPTTSRPRPPLPQQPETRAPGRGTLRDDSATAPPRRPGTQTSPDADHGGGALSAKSPCVASCRRDKQEDR